MKSKLDELVSQAEQLARTAPTWADLSNNLFDPSVGLLAKAFPRREDRYAFIRTQEFQQIQQILAQAMQRHGQLSGATPTKIPTPWCKCTCRGLARRSLPIHRIRLDRPCHKI